MTSKVKEQEQRTILLVEDDDLSLKSLSLVISSLGHVVLAARSAEEALELVDKKQINLLMTDFHLPGINGVDLVTELRDEGVCVPVVLISGYLNEAVQKKAKDAQVDVMISKPPDLLKLENVLTRLLGQSLS